MKINVKEISETEINVKYICADLGVRYWEDSKVDGVDDISYEEQKEGAKPRMPLAAENPDARHKDEKYRWVIKIDIETGNLVGWPNGVTADVVYKVCDDGLYWLEDENGNEIHKIDSYVPMLFDFVDESFGDYITMTIKEDGHIKEWYNEDRLKYRIEDFLEREGF